MQILKDDPDLTLQIIVTGMHLSPEFGLTFSEIEKDGFTIDKKVEMLISSDTPVGQAKSMGLGMIGISDALSELRPDIIVALGDRFEIFVAVSTALVFNIPVAHIHGGELTEGAFDDALRHSITKMSRLHFVATDVYRRRVIQLGELPESVFMVGGLGIDNIKNLKLLGRLELENILDFNFGEKSLLVTFHPVTLEAESTAAQMQELLDALSQLGDTQLIFTSPNADTDGRILIRMIESFVSRHKNARLYPSLGQLLYLSCIAQVDGVVGNSSSGIIEVPSFKKGTINIGDRQRGRLQSPSVINCLPDRQSILRALERLYSESFLDSLNNVENPYGDGGASKKVVTVLKNFKISEGYKKSFYDLAH